MGQTLSAPVTDKNTTEDSNTRFAYGASSMQGWRVSMEDAHSTLLELSSDDSAGFFAVFDGHGGQNAAKYAAAHLHKRIGKEATYGRGEFKEAIKTGFLGVDYDLKTDSEFPDEVSGCTAVAALITPDNRIFVGNAGDSRSVLSQKGIVKDLSVDHKPSNPIESERISKAGGFIEYGRVNGNLALSRAIGDFEFKQNHRLPAEEQIVTADPDITEHAMENDDEFLIVACDGIWDCLSSQEAVTEVSKLIAEGRTLGEVCEIIMEQCLARDSDSSGVGCDNMTIVVVALLNGKTYDEWQSNIASRCAIKSNVDTDDETTNDSTLIVPNVISNSHPEAASDNLSSEGSNHDERAEQEVAKEESPVEAETEAQAKEETPATLEDSQTPSN